MRTKIFSATVAILIIVLLCLHGWPQPPPRSATRQSEKPSEHEVATGEPMTVAAVVESEGNVDAPTKATAAASEIVPLPPSTLPLAEQLPALLRNASKGDPLASCRLVVSIIRCKEEKRSRETTESMIRSLARNEGKSDHLILDTVAREQETRESSGRFCRNVDTLSLPHPDEVMRNSLGSLSPRQKTLLVLTRSDGTLIRINGRSWSSESNGYILPQFLSDHSVDFLMDGFRAKDPLALEGLAMLHAPANILSPYGVRVKLPNPRLFMQYALLMLELYGPNSIGESGLTLVETVGAGVSPDEMDRIREWVRSEADQWRTFAAQNPTAPSLKAAKSAEQEFAACED